MSHEKLILYDGRNYWVVIYEGKGLFKLIQIKSGIEGRVVQIARPSERNPNKQVVPIQDLRLHAFKKEVPKGVVMTYGNRGATMTTGEIREIYEAA